MIEKIKNEEIWRHWENKAKSNSDYTATGPDYNLRDLEVFKISRYLKKNNFVIDFGCGTGRATYEYSKKVKEIVGIDFSPSMIDIAKSRYKNPNLKFAVGDILNPQKFDKLADVIMTTRCIINLTSWLEQKKAIKNMINLLKSSGTLILAETFEEPFSGCDKTRKKFGLKPLERPWHNKFLSIKEVLKFLEDRFDNVQVSSFGLYYLISRIVHPAFVQPEEPEYNNKLNNIALSLQKIFDSQNLLSSISPISVVVAKQKKL